MNKKWQSTVTFHRCHNKLMVTQGLKLISFSFFKELNEPLWETVKRKVNGPIQWKGREGRILERYLFSIVSSNRPVQNQRLCNYKESSLFNCGVSKFSPENYRCSLKLEFHMDNTFAFSMSNTMFGAYLYIKIKLTI